LCSSPTRLHRISPPQSSPVLVATTATVAYALAIEATSLWSARSAADSALLSLVSGCFWCRATHRSLRCNCRAPDAPECHLRRWFVSPFSPSTPAVTLAPPLLQPGALSSCGEHRSVVPYLR
jgi:hypothetical protein